MKRLTTTQRALITKARTGTGGEAAVSLDDAMCSFLVATIVRDLGLSDQFPEVDFNFPPFFKAGDLHDLRIEGLSFLDLFAKLIAIRYDADTYFFCLATLHKARLKFARTLAGLALPSIDQIGPRGLLQYGALSPQALAGLLFWRKWLHDLERRASLETSYVFEPIIAAALGGVPYSAQRSPVSRAGAGVQGRQVDCILDRQAYAIKLRLMGEELGQARWLDELAFPADCRASGYTPVLVVLDATPGPRLEELRQAYIFAGGEAHTGEQAWQHLATLAGPTMARFLELYVYAPLRTLVSEAPAELPELRLRFASDRLIMEIGAEYLVVQRTDVASIPADMDEFPEDIDECVPIA